MKTLRWPSLFLSSAILAGCSSAAVQSDRDFAFTFSDLSATVDGATAPDLLQPSNDDLAGADLSGADLSATSTDMAAPAADASQPNLDSGGTTTAVTLTLNEVNPRITGGADEVELLAHGAGSISGWTLTLGVKTTGVTPVVVATMPDLTVADGDFVVVHLKSTTVTTETTAGGKAGCTDATCVATAWDVLGNGSDLADSARVLTLSNASGTIVDGLAYSNAGGGATWPAQLQQLQADKVWDPTPCANSCAATTDADALAVATGSTTTGVQSSVAGKSMQRTGSTIPSTKADWTIKASTWGAAN